MMAALDGGIRPDELADLIAALKESGCECKRDVEDPFVGPGCYVCRWVFYDLFTKPATPQLNTLIFMRRQRGRLLREEQIEACIVCQQPYAPPATNTAPDGICAACWSEGAS